MKFRFCGGLEPPDWLLAEIPVLSEGTCKLTSSDLDTMCQILGADIDLQEETLDRALSMFDNTEDTKAAIAALHFILTHAVKYDTERADLFEELQQLGMHQSAAEVIAQNCDDQRVRIQEQLRAQRFRFPGIKAVEYTVKAASRITLNLKLDQPVVECDVVTTPSTAATNPELSFGMTKTKFLALYEELSQAQSILRSS